MPKHNEAAFRVNVFKDHTDKYRAVFRAPGQPRKTILSGYPTKGSAIDALDLPENRARYESLLTGTKIEARTNSYGKRTMAQAIESYFKCNRFTSKKPATQRTYRAALKDVQEKDGHRYVCDLTRQAAQTVIEDIGARSPGLANTAKAVLTLIMQREIVAGHRDNNPFDMVERYEIGEHRTWTEEEIAKFEARWPIGTRERLAFALMLYTGQRGESDVRRMRRSMIVKGWMNGFTQTKTGTTVDIPIHPELARIILLTGGDDVLLPGPDGKEIKASTMGKMMAMAIDEADLPDDCVPHGLRKACCRRLAEAGATVLQIMAITGHKSIKEVERYTKGVDRKKMAAQAMALLSSFGEQAAPLMIEYKPENELEIA